MSKTLTILSLLLYYSSVVICFKSIRLRSMDNFEELNMTNPEFIGGKAHECYRNCNYVIKRTCNYTFFLSQYTSNSFACRNCPINRKDCFLPGCITAGGHIRPITVANHMLPGPSIQVCEGDKVRVKVINSFTSDSVTIHWHGMHQRSSPHMDGVPYVTQCPIPPHNEFTYEFIASPGGTHVWHSHIGFEDADGLYGSLIVRKANDKLQQYYDYDLADHVMIIWHWYNSSTVSNLATALHKNSIVYGQGILINGLASHVKTYLNDTVYEAPRKIFHVHSGKRYRFRVINNSPLYCPIQLSIDDHDLLMIASEVGTFEPVSVSSLFINAGERYDFVLNANRKPANYWIRYRGSGDCKKGQVKISEVAVLHYDEVTEKEPTGSIHYDHSYRSGVLFNPIYSLDDSLSNPVIKIVELNNTNVIDDISYTPNHTFYFTSSYNTYDSYYAPGPYPQINGISFEYPPIPLLTQRNELHDDMYCREDDHTNKDCIAGYCTCPLVYRVSKNSLVEMIYIDTTKGMYHPMHFHGHGFYVVAQESMGADVSLETVKRLNEQGLIKKKLKNAPYKDNISIIGEGYTVIRFIASNPGYWLLHCHVGNHMEMGMSFVVKVGEHEDMVKPPMDFPMCGNWQPN